MTKFEIAMREKILTTIFNLDAGTVGISRDCLWQLTCRGLGSVSGAPQGTNAPFVARSIFDAIVSEPAFAKFVYADSADYVTPSKPWPRR